MSVESASAKMWREAEVIESRRVSGQTYTELVELVRYQEAYGIRSKRTRTKSGALVSGAYSRYEKYAEAEKEFRSITES